MIRPAVGKPSWSIGSGGNFSRPFQQKVGQDSASPQRSCYTQTFMTGRKPDAVAKEAWTNQRQLVRSRGAVPGPGAGGGELSERGHVFEGAVEHAVENRLVHKRIFRIKLPRGADQHLAGFAGLYVKRDRILADAVGAFEIAQFDD